MTVINPIDNEWDSHKFKPKVKLWEILTIIGLAVAFTLTYIHAVNVLESYK